MNAVLRSIAFATVVLIPFAAAAAQSGTDTATTTTSAAGPTAVSNSAEANAISDRYLTSVQAELATKVDAKNAAVGQQVSARTRADATLADGTSLPKGTRLVGHILQVQAPDKASGRTGSSMTIAFEHAELKGGQTVKLRAVIRTIGPPAAVSAPSMMGNGPMGTDMGPGAAASTSGRGGLGSGAGAGGGLGTGSVGGTVRGAGRTAGSTAGSVTSPTMGPVAQSGVQPVVQAGESVSTAARTTALPGVLLTTSAEAGASGTLIAPGKDLTLETGTQITLGVIAQ